MNAQYRSHKIQSDRVCGKCEYIDGERRGAGGLETGDCQVASKYQSGLTSNSNRRDRGPASIDSI
jgi:hypothetical protein